MLRPPFLGQTLLSVVPVGTDADNRRELAALCLCQHCQRRELGYKVRLHKFFIRALLWDVLVKLAHRGIVRLLLPLKDASGEFFYQISRLVTAFGIENFVWVLALFWHKVDRLQQ